MIYFEWKGLLPYSCGSRSLRCNRWSHAARSGSTPLLKTLFFHLNVYCVFLLRLRLRLVNSKSFRFRSDFFIISEQNKYSDPFIDLLLFTERTQILLYRTISKIKNPFLNFWFFSSLAWLKLRLFFLTFLFLYFSSSFPPKHYHLLTWISFFLFFSFLFFSFLFFSFSFLFSS